MGKACFGVCVENNSINIYNCDSKPFGHPWPYFSKTKKSQLLKLFQLCCNMLFFTVTEENSAKQVDDLGSQFTEIFIKQQENVTLLLTLVEVSNCVMIRLLRDGWCFTWWREPWFWPPNGIRGEVCQDPVKVGLEVSQD